MNAVAWHKGDITDAGFVLNLLNELRPDCVFHFAAQVSPLSFLLYLLSSVELSDTTVLTTSLGTTSHFCEEVVPELRTVPIGTPRLLRFQVYGFQRRVQGRPRNLSTPHIKT